MNKTIYTTNTKLWAAVTKHAAASGTSVSAIIERALHDYMAQTDSLQKLAAIQQILNS